MVTSVWAISGDSPVMMTLAPMSREASTVCTRWLATASSTSGTPVMSMTTTLARCVRMPPSSCSVSWRARSAVEHADDRQDQQPLADRQHRGGQLADRVLLLPDDPLALLDEAHRDGVGDAVRRRLVGVEHPVEQREVPLVLLEQRAGQHVAQQQHDADDLVGLHAARDDPLGQVAGVVLQRLHAAGLQHLDVVVVDRRRLRGHLLAGHRLEQVRLLDPARPTPAAAWCGARAGARPAAGRRASVASDGPVGLGRRRPVGVVLVLVIASPATSSWSRWCRDRSPTRSRTRPSAAGLRAVRGPGRW